MKELTDEDYLTAINKASEKFGADPAYFGEEGAAEVFNQLIELGYDEKYLRMLRGY